LDYHSLRGTFRFRARGRDNQRPTAWRSWHRPSARCLRDAQLRSWRSAPLTADGGRCALGPLPATSIDLLQKAVNLAARTPRLGYGRPVAGRQRPRPLLFPLFLGIAQKVPNKVDERDDDRNQPFPLQSRSPPDKAGRGQSADTSLSERPIGTLASAD